MTLTTTTHSRPQNKASSFLKKLGLQRDMDLILHLPIRYEDETQLSTIAQACAETLPGKIFQVEGIIENVEVSLARRRQLLIRLADKSGTLWLRFLNFYASQVQQMVPGKHLRVRGEIRTGLYGAEIVHPVCKLIQAEEPLPQTLTPVYPSTAGLSQAYLRKAIAAALLRTKLTDTLPEAILKKTCNALALQPFAEAIRFLHHPPPLADQDVLCERQHPAWRRIKFDELLAQQLSFKRAHLQRRVFSAPPILKKNDSQAWVTQLCNSLPFTLTVAQQNAWNEISDDLTRPYPMQRLLQGDVGSGKTIVAAMAALQAAEQGYQVALMVPTELLAEQHFHKFSTWLAPLNVNVVWLASSLRKQQKKHIYQQIADNAVHIVIGTHALIQKGVNFYKLGLAIIDEQHRFGVAQRLALRQLNQQNQTVPHQLMMSATPIPRTLAMTYYADLDVSTIDTLPPGRTPVLTRVVNEARRIEVIERIRSAAQDGRQIYWVCPLIEESEALQLQTAVDTYNNLCQILPELSIGMIHGRLTATEKAELMARFINRQIQLLVATTVIEVGVDVPNASLMVIEHAERFGLAQLHQLRGRVGRGNTQSVCVLLYQGPLSYQAKQRLAILRETNNGFLLAQRDLEMRGPGEFLGAKQSGQALLRFADLNLDGDLVEPARLAAEEMLNHFPDAVNEHLERWLGNRAEFLKA